MEKLKYRYIDWNTIHSLCLTTYRQIREANFQPDIVVGIARGGWVPARILADFFVTTSTANVKVEFYHGIYETKDQPYIAQPVSGETRWKRVLLVDDISDTGNSLKATIDHLQRRKVADLRTVCLHIKPWTKQLPDYYAESTDAWIIYPWEIKEFIFSFVQQLAKEKKSIKEIESILLEIGLPSTPTKGFLTEWQHQKTE
ncbi:MAG: phosphoribosyltransferase [Promethearchaeota archaeon]